MKYLITLILLIKLFFAYSQTKDSVSLSFAENVHFGTLKSDSVFSFFDSSELIAFFYFDQTYKIDKEGVVMFGKYLKLRAIGSDGSIVYALLPVFVGNSRYLDKSCDLGYHFCLVKSPPDFKEIPSCRFIFDSKNCLSEIHCRDTEVEGACIHLVSAVHGGIRPGDVYFKPQSVSEAFLHSIILSGVSQRD
jgi:hypothetical protein